MQLLISVEAVGLEVDLKTFVYENKNLYTLLLN